MIMLFEFVLILYHGFRKVGDKVELVEAYEKFMDAIGGPLQPGDRGIVIELQLDPVGEK